MKKIKYIFIAGIIVGLLFIGGNVLKEKVSIENDKSSKLAAPLYDARIISHMQLINIDENYNPLNNSRFKLSTWNGKYSFYSSQEDDGEYYFDSYRNISIDDALNLLDEEERNKVNNIKTIGDLYNYYSDYGSEFAAHCSSNPTTSSCLSLQIPYQFVLEQTYVKSGYTKQKYTVLGFFLIRYNIDEGVEVISNDAPISISRIDIVGSNGPIGALLKYGDYSKQLKNLIDEYDFEDFLEENMEYDEEACSNFGHGTKRVINPIPSSTEGNSLFNNVVGYSEPSYLDCPPIVINKRGQMDLGISSTVNEKESINTTSNSRLSYKVNIKNNGLTSYDNKVVSTLPEGFVYVDGTASDGGVYNASNNTITWTLYRIDEGSNISLTYEAYAPNGLSGLKSYESTASIEALGIQNKIISNKTIVRLMANPKTNAPLYGIGITLLIVWVVAIYLYIDHKRKLIKQ